MKARVIELDDSTRFIEFPQGPDGAEDSQAWPEPEPINNELLPVEPLPSGIIPGPYKGWVVDVAYRMQCPIDFVAAAAVVMTGAVIGAGCGIRPKRQDDWLVVPNLWGACVGRPSTLKSPSMEEALTPLIRLELAAKRAYEDALKAYAAEHELLKAHKEALRGDMVKAFKGSKGSETPEILRARYASLEEAEKPARRRYKTNDSTVEKLGELLGENPRGILTFRDELMGLLGHLDKEEFKEDRAFYLQGWNGTAALFTYDRIGRGTIDIENVCVSVFGGIQPSRLKEYLYYANRNVLNDGLIQRFQLAVYPDEPDWNLVDKWPDGEAKNRAYSVIAQLAEMDFTLKAGAHHDEGDRIPYLRFAGDAQALFYEWLTDLQGRVKTEEHPIIAEHLCKYPSLMPSLALIFHLVEVAAEQAAGPVSLHSTEQAAAWCDYLETHAQRIYGLSQDITQHAAATLARKIQEGRFGDGFTARDVYRNLRGVLADRDVVQAALAELVEAGWLKKWVTPPAFQQRQATSYFINPKVK